MSSIIDDDEGRGVSTADIPGAYLHADRDDHIITKFNETMSDMLVKIDSIMYRTCIQVGKYGKTNSMPNRKKSLYDCLKSGLLFWRHLSSLLQRPGFTINPYNTYVTTKIINRNQCMIIWHVDDFKISYYYPREVTKIIDILQKKY